MSLPLLHAGRTNPGLSAALDLRFALDKSLTAYRGPTPSFSRASTGSYFDGSGVLRYAALNYLQYSEQFDNAYWPKYQSSVTANAIVAPDGKTTADKLVENSTNNVHGLNVTSFSTVIGQVYTLSVYAKAGERNWFSLNLSETGIADRNTWFNLANGTIGTNAAGNTPSITSVGNGWYRCSITRTMAVSNPMIFLELANADNTRSYLGDGTSGVYLWGAQLEASSTLGAYVQTTNAANSAPRFNHTYNGTSWVSRGLLVEEQRTNILSNSEDFSSWSLQGTTVTVNSIAAPDGATTADTVYETSTTGEHNRNQLVTSATGTYTASFFVKYVNRQWAAIYIYHPSLTRGHRAWFDIQNGTVGTTAAIGTGLTNVATGITNCGNGWYRIWLTATTAATDLYSYFGCAETNGGSSSYAGNSANGYYVWGAQTELGAFPTSYIPAITATIRSADVCQITGSDFSGFWNGAEGTLVFDADGFSTTTDNQFITSVSGGSVSNSINLVRSNANDITGVGSSVLSGGVLQEAMNAAAGTMPSNISCKLSFAYKANDFAQSVNGAAVTTDTSGSIPTVSQMVIGNAGWTTGPLNGHIARLRYFNKRLPNATLQLLSEPDPTLNLQFALNKTLTPVAGPAPSFSRASTGTYFNASGVLTSASINTPRFDHVYSGGQWVSRGLLLEEQRTNIQLRSEDFENVKWIKFETTATAASAIAPDGNNTAYLLTESNNNAGHAIYWDALPCSSGVTYTLSFFVKAFGRNFCNVRLGQVSGESCYFDLANGTVGTADAGVTGRIQNVGNGWYRCSATKSSGFTTIYPSVSPSIDGTTISYQGDSSKGIYIWGASLEQGTFPTSHISTTSSSVTRSADVCQITGTSFNWMWNQGEGSVVVNYDCPAIGTLVQYQANSAASTNINTAVSIGTTQYFQVFLPPEQALINAGSIVANVQQGLSTAYKLNDFAASLNGGAVATDTAGTIPTPTRIIIGSDGSVYNNGHIAKLIYYPARLTNTKLQQLST